MTFVDIPPGSLVMHRSSRPQNSSDPIPAHEVDIAAFKLSQFELRVEDYFRVMKRFPLPQRNRKDAWIDATPGAVETFLATLNALPQEKRNNRHYRIPMEEEWEYAARAGTITPWWTGTSLPANAENVMGGRLVSGAHRKNQFGLYDMLGNTTELCQARDGWTEPAKPTASGRKVAYVIRGGDSNSGVDGCKAETRQILASEQHRNYSGGVRIVCEQR